jgi:hypothetical protein
MQPVEDENDIDVLNTVMEKWEITRRKYTNRITKSRHRTNSRNLTETVQYYKGKGRNTERMEGGST